MARTSGFKHVDRLFGGKFAELLTGYRADGWSYDKISRELYVQYDLELSSSILRRWTVALDNDAKPSSAPDRPRPPRAPLNVITPTASPAADAVVADADLGKKPKQRKRSDNNGKHDTGDTRGRRRTAHGGTVPAGGAR